MSNEGKLLTVAEALEDLNGKVGRDSAYRMIRTGEWPSVRIGRKVLVIREGLERWIQSHLGPVDA